MKGYFWAVLVAFLWAATGPLAKSSPLNNGAAFSLGRSVVALACLLCLTYLVERRSIRLSRFGSAPLLWGAFLAGVSNLCFILSFDYCSVGASIAANYASIQVTPLTERWILGRRVTRFDRNAISIVVIGLGIIFWEGVEGAAIVGLLFTVAAGLLWSVQTCFQRQCQEAKREYQLGICFFASVFSLPFALWGGWSTEAMVWSAWWPVVANGFAIAVVYVCFAQALHYLSGSQVNMILTLEIVFAPIVAFLMLGETPTTLTVFGATIVLAGAFYHGWASLKAERMRSEA